MTARRIALALLVALAAVLASSDRARAQQAPPLEAFVAQLAEHWRDGDADALVRLAPADGRILLDVAGEQGLVPARNAAAALRRLFGAGETVRVRSTRAAVTGGTPLSGFGELAWTTRPRGVTDARTTAVYVGVVLEDGAWRLRELRVLGS